MPAGGSPCSSAGARFAFSSPEQRRFARASTVLAPARLRGPLTAQAFLRSSDALGQHDGPAADRAGCARPRAARKDRARPRRLDGRSRPAQPRRCARCGHGGSDGRPLPHARTSPGSSRARARRDRDEARVRDERARRFVWQARAASSPARSPIDGSGRTAFAREHESRRDRVVDSRTHGERVAPVMAGLAVDRRHARSRAVSGLHCRCDGRHQPSCAPSARAPPRQRERARTLPPKP